MGLETMAIISIGMSAIGAVSSFVQAGQDADAAAAAAQQQNAFNQAEFSRQQQENIRVADEQKGDIVRAADQEIGSIRSMAWEVGATDNALFRTVSEVGGLEGLDLSRTEGNLKADNDALQARKSASAFTATDTIRTAQNRATSAKTGAILGFVGTGLSIAQRDLDNQRLLKAATNRTG